MHCSKAVAIVTLLAAAPGGFTGSSALEFTRKVVAFGPREPGSAASAKLRQYILSQLKRARCEVKVESFQADTPVGPVRMHNIIARFPGSSGRAVAITGHYDTKRIPGVEFVGANDGGSSTGFLLEMARVLASRSHKDDIYLVWFDGEEAYGNWSSTDGVYGSRYQAARWAADGTLARLKALVNVDMIGDRELAIARDAYSTGWLQRLVWQTAGELGLGRYFLNEPFAIEDDHVPFVRRGVPALDLIDFDYGPGHSWWHTDQDTPDKLSAESFQVVGSVLLAIIGKLESL
jgi:Zn-dependent M28 family amino/carboxypeptidase